MNASKYGSFYFKNQKYCNIEIFFQPAHYWSYLLMHEGKGSLLWALKEKEWCNSLESGEMSPARGFDFYRICFNLTLDGTTNINEIIKMTFQYLKMLKQEGPKKWIYEVIKISTP